MMKHNIDSIEGSLDSIKNNAIKGQRFKNDWAV